MAYIAINDGYLVIISISSSFQKRRLTKLSCTKIVQLGSVFLLKKINDFINYYLDNKLLLSSINFTPEKHPPLPKNMVRFGLSPFPVTVTFLLCTLFLVGDPYKTFICHRYCFPGVIPKLEF